jgi:AcrR family transcriptional regulator
VVNAGDARARERARLMVAGWTVLRRNGYANAGVAAILAEAGLGTRAFYRHFQSKDELLVEMFRASAEQTGNELAARVAAAGSPLDRLMAWIDEILAMGHDPHHVEVARMFTSPTMRAVFAAAGDEAIDRLCRPLHDALVDGAASGVFPHADPDADTATIHAIVWRLFLDAVAGAGPSAGDARRHVLRYVLPALTGAPQPDHLDGRS